MSQRNNPISYRALWQRKSALRAVYADIYRRIIEATVLGSTLEIGGGSGNFKMFAPATISTDIVFAPWLDAVCDAQRLPFASNCFANVVMVDVLHHIGSPLQALSEACRVLGPNGHLIFCEPAITPLSSLFYRFFHPEPVDMSVNPLSSNPAARRKDPWDSNQAIPTLLVSRFRGACAKAVPGLELKRLDWFSFLAYPMSGGFRHWSLLPESLAKPLLAAEWAARKWIGPLASFRLLAVYQKNYSV